jgi:hypothetical protein
MLAGSSVILSVMFSPQPSFSGPTSSHDIWLDHDRAINLDFCCTWTVVITIRRVTFWTSGRSGTYKSATVRYVKCQLRRRCNRAHRVAHSPDTADVCAAISKEYALDTPRRLLPHLQSMALAATRPTYSQISAGYVRRTFGGIGECDSEAQGSQIAKRPSTHRTGIPPTSPFHFTLFKLISIVPSVNCSHPLHTLFSRGTLLM